MARRRNENAGFFYRLRSADRSLQGMIVGAVVAVVAMTVFPGILPVARNGIQCSSLAQPLGGNNRSVLAHRSDQIDAIDLDLELDSRVIGADSPLRLVLTFINEDRGPLILHMPNQTPIVTNDPNVQGITLEITSADNSGALANQPGTYTPPAVFVGETFNTLHLLGSHSRCHETITISSDVLRSIGVVPGRDYRIRAFYTNSSDGDLITASSANATATPFPDYVNSQGVWTGRVSSEEVRFTVSTVQDTIPAE